MVEEKKKRGRPKKNQQALAVKLDYKLPSLDDHIAKTKNVLPDPCVDGKWRRDDLCVQMIMGVINKQGTIRYDFAKDLFNTATQLAYDFGWMAEKKKKLVSEEINPVLDPAYGVVVEEPKQEALANTPADILRALREG